MSKRILFTTNRYFLPLGEKLIIIRCKKMHDFNEDNFMDNFLT